MITFPDIPPAITQGDDLEDGMKMAEDALMTAISFYFDDNNPVPLPSTPKARQRLVCLSLIVSAKILLWNEMMRKGVNPAELARRMGITRKTAERLVDIQQDSDIDKLAEAMDAVGSGVRLAVECRRI